MLIITGELGTWRMPYGFFWIHFLRFYAPEKRFDIEKLKSVRQISLARRFYIANSSNISIQLMVTGALERCFETYRK